MTWIAPVGIFISIVLIIYLALKGFNIIIIAPLCSAVVILFNGMDLYSSLISSPNSFMMGLSKYIVNYFGVFLLGSILAKYMEVSGAATSIAKSILKITGTERPYSVLIAIFLISTVLTYGGISIFVVMFVILPLAKPIFKEINLSWSLVSIPIFLGASTFTMTMLPGTPSIHNVIPTVTLKTTLTAAPLLGIIGTVAAIISGLWYMKYELNKSISKNEKFEFYDEKAFETVSENVNIPSIITSITPSAILIMIIIVGSFLKIPNIILIALLISNVVSAVMFRNFIKSQKSVINDGAQGSVFPIFFTAVTVGYGTVVTTAPGFKVISDAILNIAMDPLISLTFATVLITVITGSSSGSIGIIMQNFAANYLDMGIDPEVIHRVTVMASSVLTVVPHSGLILTFFVLSGLNHKNSFKNIFVTVGLTSAISLIIVLITAIVLY